MSVVFFHGLESSPVSDKSEWLTNEYGAWCPAMDYRNPNLFNEIHKEILKRKPSLLIGSSMGGWFAYCLSTLTGIPTLLFNPALHSRSIEPNVKLGVTPAKHIIVLGKNDKVIDPKKTKNWLSKNGVGNFDIREENIEHRSPLKYLKLHMPMINEEWSTESPIGADLSFLPEGLQDFVINNPLSSRPFQNMGVGNTVESEVPEVVNAQKNLSDEERVFILNAANEPYEIFYRWLVLRGQRPNYGEIKSMWNNMDIINLIKKMKEAVKRPRPYWISKDVNVAKGTESEDYSYPSGHSILAWVIAKKLGKQYPHLQDGLNHLAYRIARSRIQAGVHFPTDVNPGSEIAECMIQLGY